MRTLLTVLLVVPFCLSLSSAQDSVVPSGLCGDGVLDPGESCDPGQPDHGVDPDLGGATCGDQGFNGGGEITCTSKCTLDISACYCGTGGRLPATGQRLCWDVSGQRIDCPDTGHDGDTQAGSPMTYTDNGDGTITDENTGLMWEKKIWDGGIHDWRRAYTWKVVFEAFVDRLNHTCEGDGLVPCDNDDLCGAGGQCGFAGYRDWRLPNVKELLSLVDYGRRYPSIDPVFHGGCVWNCTECSCTSTSERYWTSTTDTFSKGRALSVSFRGGEVYGASKWFLPRLVRAVRGGLD